MNRLSSAPREAIGISGAYMLINDMWYCYVWEPSSHVFGIRMTEQRLQLTTFVAILFRRLHFELEFVDFR